MKRSRLIYHSKSGRFVRFSNGRISDPYCTAVTKKQHLCSQDLKSRLVWILNGPKEVELQVVRILNGI